MKTSVNTSYEQIFLLRVAVSPAAHLANFVPFLSASL